MSIEPPSTTASVPPPPKRMVRRRKKNYFWPRLIAGASMVVVVVGVGAGLNAAWSWFANRVPAEGKQVAVLLIGVDPRPLPVQAGDETTRRLADSLHLVSIDSNGSRGYVLSIPRQTGALIGSMGAGHIGDALAVGGVKLLKETVAQVTGIPVEHHVWVELDGTKSVLELAGETEVYWPKAETIVDKEAGLSLTLAEGWQRMPAEQARNLAWAHTKGGELERIERQQMLLHRWHRSAHEAWLPLGFGSAVGKTLGAIQTDLPKSEFESLAGAWRSIRPERLVFATLPGEVSRAGSWIVNSSRLEKISEQLMVAPNAPLDSKDMPTLEILYDDKGDIQVMELAEKLTKRGFRVIRTSRHPVAQWDTRIVDRKKAEQRSQATIDALVGTMGPARVLLHADEPSAYGADYTLELGKGFFR